ncbi:MAG TPA: hypothetical protein VIF62_21650, partial [Labilithrix sp.]
MSTANGSGNGRAGNATRLAAMPSIPPSRRKDRVAELGQLRARLELARVIGDDKDEREAARKLAERLAQREIELESAVEIASRTLGKVDDPPLRHMLAGWLEGLGEPGLAAAELRRLVAGREPKTAGTLLVRIGVLHARAADSHGAEEALAEAARADEKDSLPLELLAAIHGSLAGPSAPEGAGSGPLSASGTSMSPRSAAEAYVRAAQRRAQAGDAEGELEDLLRAFEVDPTSAFATAALALAHEKRDRASAADEVMRTHAAALAARGKDVDAAEVHARRRAVALEAGDLGRALGAALDEELDATLDGAAADAMDEILARAAMYEPLSARLGIRAEKAAGRASSQRWAELGRLLSGALAAPDRAIEAYARAVAADATNSDALQSLRALAERAESAWLVEALVRGAMGDAAYGGSPEPESRLAAARALAEVADEKRDAVLAAWAWAEVRRVAPEDERARNAAGRLEGELARREEELVLARRTLETSAEGGRRAAVEELARLLRSDPSASRELAPLLAELARASVSSEGDADARETAEREAEATFAEAARVAERISDFGAVATLCRERLAKGGPPRVRIALVAALRRGGDARAAADAATALFDAVTPWAYAVAWIQASVSPDGANRAMRARALAAVAQTCGPKVLPVVAAVAAEALAKIGDAEGARRAATIATRADMDNARAARVLAEAPAAGLHAPAEVPEARIVVAALERAVGACGPSAALCARLADAYEELGDAAASIAWARRVVALRPGDTSAVKSLVDRAMRLPQTAKRKSERPPGDAGTRRSDIPAADALGDALVWIIPQPRPARATVELIVPALLALAERDPGRASDVARRALDVLGPRHAALRDAIGVVTKAARDVS